MKRFLGGIRRDATTASTDALQDVLSDPLGADPLVAPVQADGGDLHGPVPRIARDGISGPGRSLPHSEVIQESFGRYDVSGIRAHVDSAAGDAAHAMGASAYATGHHVAFSGTPSLHTAAHEAAHVVQQRAGVSLRGGVGQAGDPHERHADAVADAVVAGRPAEPLLDAYRGGGSSGGTVVQRKALVGKSYEEPENLKDPKVRKLHDDGKVRRFKDNAELKAYANGSSDTVGMTGRGDWVRIEDFQVLGEDHGTQIAPEIIKALGTKKFRYEGWARIDKDRLDASRDLTGQVTARHEERKTKLGVETGDEKAHAAEDVVPKYARAIPDVHELAKRQITGKMTEDTTGDLPPDAGKTWEEGYSLQQTLVKTLLDALLYVQSYKKKWFSHTLKAFYKDHSGDVDSAIKVLRLAEAKKRVPDFSKIALVEALPALQKAFESEAIARLGGQPTVDRLKSLLDTRNEPRVALTDEAKRLDYLRDISMYNTIHQSKAAGDVLFVIGDAHRKKLATQLQEEGISVATDDDFLDEQKALNKDAGRGISPGQRAEIEEYFKAVTDALMEDDPYDALIYSKVGQTFTLPSIAGGTWEVRNATRSGDTYTSRGTVEIYATHTSTGEKRRASATLGISMEPV